MKFLKVLLRSSAGEVELDTKSSGSSFALLDGVRGLGLPMRSVESSPLPSANGSVFRSGRFDESEVLLPIAIRGADASVVAERVRQLEHVLQVFSDEPIELVVEAPGLSTVRRRYVYYTEGLEGAIGGQDSHFTWRHANVKFQALDPMWYGQERVLTQRVDAARKPFITSKVAEPDEGAVVHREDRAPTPDDEGSDGDVWFVGANAEPEKVLRRNLIPNPSFETGTSGWTGNSLSLDQYFWTASFDTSLLTGPAGLRATVTSTASAAFVYSDYIPAAPGSTVVRVAGAASGGRFLLRVFFYDAGKARIGDSSSSYISTASVYSPDLAEVQAIAPEGTDSMRVYLYLYAYSGGPLAVGDRFYFDSIFASSAGDYFDGDTEPSGNKLYRWTGPAHASTSEEYTPATAFKPMDKYVHNGTEWEHVGLEKRAPFLPIVLASSTVDGAYQLNIQGDAEAWPVWEIDGPGEDLLIENVRTGERIFIEGEFGETVTIDTRPIVADIYSDTDQDGQLWERVADDYTLFPLTPGENRIKITMVNARPNSVVRLRYSETWLAGW